MAWEKLLRAGLVNMEIEEIEMERIEQGGDSSLWILFISLSTNTKPAASLSTKQAIRCRCVVWFR